MGDGLHRPFLFPMSISLTQLYCLPFQLLSSVPLAVRYRTTPSDTFYTLQQIGKVESNYKYDASNPQSSAEGIYQLIDGASKLNKVWKHLPMPVSVPLQHLDLVLHDLTIKSAWNGGSDRMIIEHHGVVKFSDWQKDNSLDWQYYDAVKRADYIKVPAEVLLASPLLLMLI